LARILAKYQGTQLGVETEFLHLMQEARLPQSRRQVNATDPLIGWTRQETARFSELLDQMEENEAPSKWITLGKIRRRLLNLKSALGGRHTSHEYLVRELAAQIQAGLQQFPNQQALEVRHMRSELSELTGH
jgi:hypothetical protein